MDLMLFATHILYVFVFILTLVIQGWSLKNEFQTRINFGSCYYPGYDDSIWKSIAERNGELFIWTGDATYLDYQQFYEKGNIQLWSTVLFGIPPAHVSTFNETWQISILNSTLYNQYTQQCPNIIGIWDDHDYGVNDGMYINPHKDYAQQLYLDFLNYPSDDPLRKQKGLYSHYPFVVKIPTTEEKQKQKEKGDSVKYIEKTIDVILLDNRYFAQESGKEDILGTVQWKWFENILSNKINGDLTLIISGVQIMPCRRGAYIECWGRFHESQLRLSDLVLSKINENNNKNNKNGNNFLFISGDVHHGSIMRMDCYNKETNEPISALYEITSSGLTHSLGDDASFVIRNLFKLTTLSYFDPDQINQCQYLNKNFGELNIIWDTQTGTLKRVSMDVMDVNGKSQCTQDLPIMNRKSFSHVGEKEREYEMKLIETDKFVCYPRNYITEFWSKITLARLYCSFIFILSIPFLMAVLILVLTWWWFCGKDKSKIRANDAKKKR